MNQENAATPDPRQDEVEAVHDVVRQWILHNRLEAGEAINQVDVARRLGVSRGPVREALRLLQREGLVDYERNRKMRVSLVSVSDLDELYAMRISLEAFAIRLTVPQVTAKEIEALDAALGHMDELALANDVDAWEVVHAGFHEQLVAHAGPRIRRTLAAMAEHCERYRRIYIAGEMRAWAQGAAEHASIVEAVRERNADAAAERLGRHFARTALTVAAIVAPDQDPFTVRAAVRAVTAGPDAVAA